jgi:hypothetical protein
LKIWGGELGAPIALRTVISALDVQPSGLAGGGETLLIGAQATKQEIWGTSDAENQRHAFLFAY